ncbi:MAG: hypothetical protein HQ579_07565 [Candidatus Omnitrophica bacterium]|nr:hypothetical protein [Candidatus Omnitrophota bacterium]
MEEKIYRCDKCKEQVDTPEELVCISIELSINSCRPPEVRERMDMCSICAEKLGLIRRYVEGKEILPGQAPNVEEKLYDIIADIVHDVHCDIDHRP